MKLARPVFAPDLTEQHSLWPSFTEAVLELGIASLFAFPLVLGPLRIGAIDLYSLSPITLDPVQTTRAGEMARLISRQILRSALDDAERFDSATTNAYSRRVIHQATGMLLAQLDISASDALLVIQGHAFAAARSMMDVAQDIVDRNLTFSKNDESVIESSP